MSENYDIIRGRSRYSNYYSFKFQMNIYTKIDIREEPELQAVGQLVSIPHRHAQIHYILYTYLVMFPLSPWPTNWKRLAKVMIIRLSGNLMPSGCVAFCFHSFSHTECLMRMDDDGMAWPLAPFHLYHNHIHHIPVHAGVTCVMPNGDEMMIWRQTKNVFDTCSDVMWGWWGGVDGKRRVLEWSAFARCCSRGNKCCALCLLDVILV